MEQEIFRQVSGYEGLYSVSNKGRVLGEKRNRILKPAKNQCGYRFVVLFKDNAAKNHLVHRLVAEAFIDNPDNLPQINHKDENKDNNCVDNLKWCTAKYNCNYGSRNEKTGNNRRNGKLAKPVRQYSLDGEFIKDWPSAIEVTRQLGFNQGGISRCCLGQIVQAYGYKWEYKK